ncbi:hypothetical protein ACFQAT_02025 [Undibacterium arcticum]|uniref:hypothetical protein n=1 Tax=Undibacterium arcticum TaxID=1762892 RepID=UPI00360B6469
MSYGNASTPALTITNRLFRNGATFNLKSNSKKISSVSKESTLEKSFLAKKAPAFNRVPQAPEEFVF